MNTFLLYCNRFRLIQPEVRRDGIPTKTPASSPADFLRHLGLLQVDHLDKYLYASQ